MKPCLWRRPLELGAAGLLVLATVAGVAEDPPTQAPPAIQPTPVKLPPPGPRPNAGGASARPRVRTGTNSAANFVATNSSVAVVRTNTGSGRAAVVPDRFQRANVEEFDQLRARPDAVVVDVRTAEEFAQGHLPKAGLVDIKSVDFMATIAGLDRSKLYLVNCAAGARSVRACQNFAALGFTNVVNLDGGFNAWLKAKPNVVSVEPAVALPQSPQPNMEKSGTAKTPPPAQPASTNKHPVFNAPLIIKKPTPKKVAQ